MLAWYSTAIYFLCPRSYEREGDGAFFGQKGYSVSGDDLNSKHLAGILVDNTAFPPKFPLKPRSQSMDG